VERTQQIAIGGLEVADEVLNLERGFVIEQCGS
jgi:hypothetical protein